MKSAAIIFLAFLLQLNLSVYAQNYRFSGNYKGKTMQELFTMIESQSQYRFFYNDDLIDTRQKVDIQFDNLGIEEILNKILKDKNIRFEILENNLIVLIANRPGQAQIIQGNVTDMEGKPLPGVTILAKVSKTGTISDMKGNFSIKIRATDSILIFSFIGMETKEMSVYANDFEHVTMVESAYGIDEIIAVGYGFKRKETLTGAISAITATEMEQVHASTVSSTLAGKIGGVTYRMSDGRPGSSANIQIRNMGEPLYIIDGIQKDIGHFNNLSPNDIESISILKDASASIYGVRGANGVVVVTTKRGQKGAQNVVNVDAYTGWQNWSRFPETVGAYEWMLGKADAEMNLNGTTEITPEELQKWKEGTESGYQSFDWYNFIIRQNSPQTSFNVNTSGGSERIAYYLSLTQLDQRSVLGDEFRFSRTNVQSNLDAQITDRLVISAQMNGRIETRDYPGLPGTDDYWAPRFALFRNRPTERPYANDNPDYINDIGHMDTNWALLNKELSGYWREDWRVLQMNYTADYETPVKGLSLKGTMSYYFADRLMNGHEYTYDAYTYYPDNPEGYQYVVTFSNLNPWRERGTRKVLEWVIQTQATYNRKFGDHHVEGIFVNERIERRDISTWLHAVPKTNALPLVQFEDMDTYDDGESVQARIGYIGRFNYSYKNKYFVELSGRRDASWIFAKAKRWAFFPSVSGAWRITDEKFIKKLLGDKSLNLKLRGSYGELGDDNVGIDPYASYSGYNYATSTNIIDGEVITGARDRGTDVNTEKVSWYTSQMTDFGADYTLKDGRISGSLDYFYRRREGILANKEDEIVPEELGYDLPLQNLNSDAITGAETSISYNGKIRSFKYTVGGNISVAREMFLHSYNPKWGNSWDHYRNSQEDRWTGTFWGYEAIGQFESFDQINSWPVDNDGEGNSTMLPGDLIYKDVNEDGLINAYDERPIGYPGNRNPIFNFGVNFSCQYKGFDFRADFSGATGYAFNQNYEMRWPYQNTGNLLKQFYEDRWHREDPYDLNSEWIPGTYPALRYNTGWHSNYNKNSTFWLTNVHYLRSRTIELGYSLPRKIIRRAGLKRVRIFVNTYNLFSFDNLKELGVEPEVMDANGLQYPQNRLINVGVNVTF
ncbi:TonB-dependent receptor [Saccharicrinis sp. FJH62]|uniref:TonB-dependent receptor n=1 Tax=Saccharicrinis sp. FJH62 TaxID=3344657 RepID=UPI0035D460D3